MLGADLAPLVAGSSGSFTKGKERAPFTPDLQAGDYVWKPDISPAGPVVIVVSLPQQTLFVYRNGIRIGRSTVSTGKSGHRTPTGVFTILQKKVEHTSSIYKGASMPYMQRLTWDGIAMHAGNLPGYPASHGCVRLPIDFAQKLYKVTACGSTVIVTDGGASSKYTTQPGLLLSSAQKSGRAPLAAGGFVWEPEKAPSGPVSILLSSADREAYVYRNGVEIGRASIGGAAAGESYGSHVYTALDISGDDGLPQWESLGSIDDRPSPDIGKLRKHLILANGFLADARSVITPGTTLILTDQPVNGKTRSSRDFDILTAN